MDKPFSMLYGEFKENMANLINNSGIPLFVVESVLQNYLYEVNNAAKNQFRADKYQYEQLLFAEDNEPYKNNEGENIDDSKGE